MQSSRANTSGVAKLIKGLPPEVGALARAVRRLVLKQLPRVTESPDHKARLIGYSYGPGYSGLIATIILSRRGVKLGIVRGADLPDPTGLLAGAGKVHRYVTFASLGDVTRPDVSALLGAAVAAWQHRQSVRA